MAKLLPIRTFTDQEGDPLSSGLVYTYDYTTSQLATTYTDSTEGTAHPNPVVLDSSGSKDIWLDPAKSYRLIVKDSKDTIVWSIDNVDGVGEWKFLAGDLDVNGNSIVSSSNGDITITPAGSGYIILDGQKWPQSDGSASYIIKTDGEGTLSWVPPNPGLLLDTTPQLGGALDSNSYNINIDNDKGLEDENGNEQLLFTTSSNSAVNYFNITNSATSNAPELAAAGSDTNIDINIVPKSAGNIIMNDYDWPKTDGESGEFLIVAGSGVFGWGQPNAPVIQMQYETISNFVTSYYNINIGAAVTTSNSTAVATVDITPNYSNSLIELEVYIHNHWQAVGPFFDHHPVFAVFKGSETSASYVYLGHKWTSSYYSGPVKFKFTDVSETTETITYTLRVTSTAPNVSPAYTSSVSYESRFGGVGKAFICATEFSA